MGFYDAIRVGASGATGFTIDRSVRISRDSGNYFSINNSSSGNTQTFTFSCWMKLGKLFNNFLPIYSHYLTGNNRCGIVHTGTSASSAGFQYQNRQSGSHKALIDPGEKLRDHSAWYHVVFRMDTTNSTQNNRFIIYVNGREIAQDRYIGVVQNSTSVLNSATTHYIGHDGFSGTGDFYLADIHLIDGQALDASYFAETDAATGQWIPKEYSGSYSGTSYHLKFDDNSSASALGTDSSGLGNDVTPVNFSVSAGTGNDSVEDTPTNNFPTWHPLYTSDQTGGVTAYSEGNLKLNTTTTGVYTNPGTLFPFGFTTFGARNGKWYAEFKCDTNHVAVGVANTGQLDSDVTNNPYGAYANTSIIYTSRGEVRTNNSYASQSVPTYSSGDIIGVALDLDNNKIYFHKNGSYINSGNPNTGSNGFTLGSLPSGKSGDFVFSCGSDGQQSIGVFANLGQQTFSYSIPTGYEKLCSANLPDPAIKKPAQYFETLLYTGNGGTQSITGLEFKPDWVWIKVRSHSGDNHHIYDSVRGAAKTIFTNTNDDEQPNDTDRLSAFNSDGFTLGDNYRVNGSGRTFVAWNWDAGETDSKTYTVTVVSDSGNKYRFDDFGTSAVTLDLAEGGTYIFNMDDSSNASHPFSIGTAANGTVYTSGITYFLDGVSKTYSEYTSGFSAASTRRLHITVPASAPVLYYWCSVHSGMGGQINTNSTLGSSNFDGTVQATVKANPTAGFSIVSYNVPSGSGYSVGHGLGAVPQSILVKNRDTSSNWDVYSVHIGNTKRLKLNSNAAEETQPAFNNQTPTSTVFYGLGGGSWHGVGSKMINYVFSEVAGYSKFGSYEANNSSNGPFVYLGFEPKWIMMKPIDDSGNWQIYDNKRTPINKDDGNALYADLNSAEASGFTIFDFLSNGFKLRNTGAGGINYTNTYIYLAFAESPFKNARAR